MTDKKIEVAILKSIADTLPKVKDEAARDCLVQLLNLYTLRFPQ